MLRLGLSLAGIPSYVVSSRRHYCEGKGHPRSVHEVPEGEKSCSSTLSLTSALDGVSGQCHAPAAIHPEKTQYPLYRKLGGPQGGSGRVGKILPPSGFDPRTVQPVPTRYTDWATRPTLKKKVCKLKCIHGSSGKWSRIPLDPGYHTLGTTGKDEFSTPNG